jgi:hypothetical protein
MVHGDGGRVGLAYVLLMASVIACSCNAVFSSVDGPVPTLADLPKAAAGAVAVERTIDRPPVRAGETRIAQFDIDVALPSDATVYERSGVADLLWSGCWVQITPTLTPEVPQLEGGPRVVRRVGTFELACTAGPWARNAADPRTPPDRKCLAICDHLTPVPRSTAQEPYPTDPPVIEIEYRGGFDGLEEDTLVWSDGTVQYSGSSCKTWRGSRATLAPARVAELLAAVERGGFFNYHRDDSAGCSDAIYGAVTVRSGGLRNSLRFNQCDRSGLSTLVGNLQHEIGNNPCRRH